MFVAQSEGALLAQAGYPGVLRRRIHSSIIILLCATAGNYYLNAKNNRYLNRLQPSEHFDTSSPVNISGLSGRASWILDYARWHQQTLASLDVHNWKDYKYLILYCPSHGNCEGASDRLQPAVLLLRQASKYNRMFFIRWEHPYPLEEFLLPTGIVNWSMPDWLVNATNLETLPSTGFKYGNKITTYENHTAITATLKLGFGGTQQAYDAIDGDGSYERISSDVFRILFQPSPPIANMIQERLQSAGLKRDMYASAHSRVLYFKKNPPEIQKLRDEVMNAINCASQLMPGKKIYFSSDSTEAKNEAIAYASHHNYSVIVFSDIEPIHLEYASGRAVEEYYPIFLDLYLLSYGQCMTFGEGGYGRWANSISSNASCSSGYRRGACQWAGAQKVY